MTQYEYDLIVEEFKTLKKELAGLKKDVLLLIQERDEARAAEARALEENMKILAHYRQEESELTRSIAKEIK